MLATAGRMRKHLRRLERVWIDWPIYFITTCTFNRRAILASKEVAKILFEEWRKAHGRHGWAIGCYVVMPDHVHFFCSAELDAKTLPNLCRLGSNGQVSEWRVSSTYLEESGRKNSSTIFCDRARATVKSGIMLRRIRCEPG